jgi:hypothetical protein
MRGLLGFQLAGAFQISLALFVFLHRVQEFVGAHRGGDFSHKIKIMFMLNTLAHRETTVNQSKALYFFFLAFLTVAVFFFMPQPQEQAIDFVLVRNKRVYYNTKNKKKKTKNPLQDFCGGPGGARLRLSSPSVSSG